jgi:hypothetical protein
MGTSRLGRLAVTAALAAAVTSAGLTQAGATGVVPATTAASSSVASSPTTCGQGDVQVAVGYVVFGSKLHLRRWPLRPGERLDVRIDVWVAPNASSPRLVVFKGQGVTLSGCTSTRLRPGRVNRISCSMRVARPLPAAKAHVRLVVWTRQGTYAHSFLVLVA